MVVGGVEAHLTGSGQAVFMDIKVFDTFIHSPTFVAGVEHTHDGVHHYVRGQLEFERFLEVLLVLRMQGGDYRKVVDFGVQDSCQTYCKGRRDMNDVNTALDKLRLEPWVQDRCG